MPRARHLWTMRLVGHAPEYILLDTGDTPLPLHEQVWEFDRKYRTLAEETRSPPAIAIPQPVLSLLEGDLLPQAPQMYPKLLPMVHLATAPRPPRARQRQAEEHHRPEQERANGNTSSGPWGALLTHSQKPCSPCTCAPWMTATADPEPALLQTVQPACD